MSRFFELKVHGTGQTRFFYLPDHGFMDLAVAGAHREAAVPGGRTMLRINSHSYR